MHDKNRYGFFFRCLTRRLRGKQFVEPLVIDLGIGLIELDVFPDQSMGFTGNETDLVFGEPLSMEGGDLNEIGQVSLDAGLGR